MFLFFFYYTAISHQVRTWYSTYTYCCFSFLIPFITLAVLSPSLPVVTQIRGHIAAPPPHPPPPRYVPSFLSREEFSIVFLRGLAANCTTLEWKDISLFRILVSVPHLFHVVGGLVQHTVRKGLQCASAVNRNKYIYADQMFAASRASIDIILI